MMADKTSASSGDTTRSLSSSVLEGMICSRGTISPVVGSRYWIRLWWLISRSSSIRHAREPEDFDGAQAQNA